MDSWSIEENFQLGDKIYGDREYTFSGTIPEMLLGSEWIRTANDSEYRFESGEWQADFEAAEDIDVYLVRGIDYILPAEWMEDWKDTGETLKNEEGGDSWFIYKKSFKSGEKVRLGVDDLGNREKGNYVVIVKPAQ